MLPVSRQAQRSRGKGGKRINRSPLWALYPPLIFLDWWNWHPPTHSLTSPPPPSLIYLDWWNWHPLLPHSFPSTTATAPNFHPYHPPLPPPHPTRVKGRVGGMFGSLLLLFLVLPPVIVVVVVFFFYFNLISFHFVFNCWQCEGMWF
jgi:hypothetical protein